MPVHAATPAKAGAQAAPADPTQIRAPKSPANAETTPQVAETLVVPMSQASESMVSDLGRRQDRTTTNSRRVITPAAIAQL